MSTTIRLTDNQTLVSATYGAGHSIKTYDDGFGPLFISRCSIGINGIVRAKNWYDAYEICEDEFFPEANETIEELVKEYGVDWMESDLFNEAFGFRPNGPNSTDKLNHCIYSKDLNGDYLDPLTNELVESLRIVLEIKNENEESQEDTSHA